MMIDIDDIKRLNLQPGDVLVVQCKSMITHDIHRRIVQAFQDQVPGLKDRLLLIDKSIRLAVLSQEIHKHKAGAEALGERH